MPRNKGSKSAPAAATPHHMTVARTVAARVLRQFTRRELARGDAVSEFHHAVREAMPEAMPEAMRAEFNRDDAILSLDEYAIELLIPREYGRWMQADADPIRLRTGGRLFP